MKPPPSKIPKLDPRPCSKAAREPPDSDSSTDTPEEEPKLRKVPYQYPRHCGNALLLDKVQFYLAHRDLWAPRFPEIPDTALHDFADGFANGINVLHWVQTYVEHMSDASTASSGRNMTELLAVVKSAIMLQLEPMGRGLNNFSYTEVTRAFQALSSSGSLERAFGLKKSIIELHRQIEEGADTKQQHFKIKLLGDVIIHGDMIYFPSFPVTGIILPYNMFLAVLDKIEAKYSLHVYSSIRGATDYLLGPTFLELTEWIYEKLEDCHLHLGNISTVLFKSLEALATGTVLQHLDSVTHDHEFLNKMLEELEESYPQLKPYAHRIVYKFKEILHTWGERGIPLIMEQFGQEKLHFYPIVDPEAGLIKMYSYSTAYRSCNVNESYLIGGDFVKEYVISHYMREGHLPPILHRFDYHPGILKILEDGNPGSMGECNKIPREEWARVILKKNHMFNYFPEPTDLLDDKAITPHRDHILQLFAYDALFLLNLRGPRDKENTRLILEMLERPEIDIRRFYAAVEALGYYPPNWAVIQLMPKERELKITARDFSILTFECRMMASACEHNLSNTIFKYFNQQTMSKSGSELRHTIDKLTTLPPSVDKVWIYIVLDLEQWNFTFRQALQVGVTVHLDRLFGVDHFTTSIKLFHDSVLFSAGKFSPPGTPGQFTSWDGHAGGNQGIYQKLWTLITILLIRKVMRDEDLEHFLAGSGDNQVLAIHLLNTPELQQRIKEIKLALDAEFSLVGLKVKVSESWHAQHLLAYQRRYHYKARVTEGGIKQAVRAFSGGADINIGLSNSISTAINGGIGMSNALSDPIVGPLFAYVEAYTVLMYSNTWARFIPSSTEKLALLSCLCSELGFLPFIPITSFLYSGHKDPLTECLALLRAIWDMKPNLRRLVGSLLQFERGENDWASKVQMVLSPSSINIKRPATPESVIKTAVEDFLTQTDTIQNVRLKTLFSAVNENEQIAFVKELLKIQPKNLSLLHAIFQYSTIGTTMSCVNRFNRITSIVKLVDYKKLVDEEKTFAARIKVLDIRGLKHIFQRYNHHISTSGSFLEALIGTNMHKYREFCTMHNLTIQCTFSARLFLVSYSHYFLPELILGPFTPSPLEQLIFTEDPMDPSSTSTLVITPASTIPESKDMLDRTRGPFPLYIGNKTDDPVKSLRLVNLEGVDAGSSVTMFIKLLAWLLIGESDANVTNLLTSQISMRIPGLDATLNNTSSGTAGGNFIHRFFVPGIVNGAELCSNTLASTWYHISSNLATALARKQEDRFVFFQQIFHHIISVLRFCEPYRKKIYVTIRLDCCSYLIPPTKFTADTPVQLPIGQVIPEFSFSPERLIELRKEAQHQELVHSLSILHTIPGDLCLASYVGHAVGQGVKRFQLGFDEITNMPSSHPTPQNTLNLTIVRMIPMPQLLMHINLHLSHFNCLGPKSTPHRLLSRLRDSQIFAQTNQDYKAYKPIIEALVTTHRIQELVQYTGDTWDWAGDASLLSTQRLLFAGLVKALEDWKKSPYQIYLLVEHKSPSQDLSFAVRTICNWSHVARRKRKYNRNIPPSTFFRQMQHIKNSVQALVVADKGLVVETGRKVYDYSILDQRQEQVGSPMDLRIIDKYEPDFPPWIHTKLTRESVIPLLIQIESLNLQMESVKNQSNNYFHKIAKWKSVTSGARVKLLEIIARCNLQLTDESLVVCLAEGSGSFLSTLLHINPTILGLYNSLQIPENLPLAMANLFVPPELVCACNVSHRVPNLVSPWSNLGDLREALTWTELDDAVRSLNKEVSFLTWDLGGTSNGEREMLSTLLNYLHDWRPLQVCIKLMFLPQVGYLEEVLNEILELYPQVELIKPASGNLFSKEVFLVASRLPTRSGTIKTSLDGEILTPWIQKLTPSSMRDVWLVYSKVLDWDNHHNYCRSYKPLLPHLKDLAAGNDVALLLPSISTLLDALLGMDPSAGGIPRTHQTLLGSRAVASKIFNHNMMIVLKAVLTITRLWNSSGADISPTQALDNLSNNLDELDKVIRELETKIDFPQMVNHFFKTIGFLMTTPHVTRGFEMANYLTFIKTLLDVSPLLIDFDDFLDLEKDCTSMLENAMVPEVIAETLHPLHHLSMFTPINNLLKVAMGKTNRDGCNVITYSTIGDALVYVYP